MLLLQVQIQFGVLFDKCFPCASRKVPYKKGIKNAIKIPTTRMYKKRGELESSLYHNLAQNDTTHVNLK